MRVYIFGKSQYHESSDFFNENYPLGDLEKHVDAIIRCFTKRRAFRELLESYSQRNNLEGYILLHAHGLKKSKEWMFVDGKRRHIMQNWIDHMDGQALAILLRCCNPKDYELHSKKSVIIHPRDSVNITDLIRGNHLRIYIPGEGYIEDNYYRLRKSTRTIARK